MTLNFIFEAGSSTSANTQGISCTTSYRHPSLFCREEDALALFPRAASPLWREHRKRVRGLTGEKDAMKQI